MTNTKKIRKSKTASRIATSLTHLEAFDARLTAGLARKYFPLIEAYHRADISGLDNLPAADGFVAVGNLGGVHFMPEAWLWITKYHTGLRTTPMVVLMPKMLHFWARVLGLPLNQLGLLDNTPETAMTALEQGYAITVYPGGDRDASKSFWERNKIDFFGNVGYVRAAIASQKPIVPIVGCGGGEAVYTAHSGYGLAKKLRLDKLISLRSWPLFWSFPRGWHTGHVPHFSVPLPTKVKLRVLPPISVREFKPTDADDPTVVHQLNTNVTLAMQAALNELAKGRIPVVG